MNNFCVPIDDDTQIIFDATVWCLEFFFKQSNKSAIEAVNNYYIKNKDRLDRINWRDDFYYYEGSYRIALRIYYSEILKLGIDLGIEFVDWLRNNEDINISRQVSAYLRKFYR